MIRALALVTKRWIRFVELSVCFVAYSYPKTAAHFSGIRSSPRVCSRLFLQKPLRSRPAERSHCNAQTKQAIGAAGFAHRPPEPG